MYINNCISVNIIGNHFKMKFNAVRRPEVGLFEKSIINVNKGGVMNVKRLFSLRSWPWGCVGN